MFSACNKFFSERSPSLQNLSYMWLEQAALLGLCIARQVSGMMLVHEVPHLPDYVNARLLNDGFLKTEVFYRK